MDNQDIDAFVRKTGMGLEAVFRPPIAVWEGAVCGYPMFVQTQEDANRMRIVVFIAEADDLEEDELSVLMEANYHSALDARYALADGYLVSAFIHPLAELTATQFTLGLYQALHCAETRGTTYSGGTLVFGPSTGEGDVSPAEDSVGAFFSDLMTRLDDSGRGE